MKGILLKFYDRSYDPGNSDVAVYQRDTNSGQNAPAVAWKVIRNCGRGCHHPFTLSSQFEVSVEDNDGNFAPRLKAWPGQRFQVTRTLSGNELTLNGVTENPDAIEVQNSLAEPLAAACIFKDGRGLATRKRVGAGESACFSFNPTIFIGVVRGVTEGEIMSPDAMSGIHTELSLIRVVSADIVMTGDGRQSEKPFEFNLENVVLG